MQCCDGVHRSGLCRCWSVPEPMGWREKESVKVQPNFQGLVCSHRFQGSNWIGQATKTLAGCDIGRNAGKLHIESHRQGMGEACLFLGSLGCRVRFLLRLVWCMPGGPCYADIDGLGVPLSDDCDSLREVLRNA